MYKYQLWSSGNEDCFSWITKSTNGFMETYGAKPYGKKIDTSGFKSIDDYCRNMREERILKIAELWGETARDYEEASSKKGFNFDVWEDDYIKHLQGKDNNMTQIKFTIDCDNVKFEPNPNKVFNITTPKFDIGTKIKFWNGLDIKSGVINWKQGVIYSINKKITISKTGDVDSKGFKADNLQWFYTIVENSNLKTWDGIKEDQIKIDDTPDYNKYFKMLGAYGLTFKEGDFTIVYWEQAPIFNSWGIVTGYNTNVTLKPKFNDNKTNLSFWTNDYSKLPTIKEKC